MRVVFTRYAKQELEDAICYYELEFPGLGKRFKDELRKATLRISERPQAWPVERGDVRKCVMHSFPYKILYAVEENHTLVIAVAHQHRRPDYWVDADET